jgi:CheY-like chemotaxis protein
MTRAGKRILLVEDHADTLATFDRLLGRWGYEVQTATCAASASAAIERGSFDLLICDIGLPDQPGTSVMRALRAVNATVPGIALTGYGMEGEIETIMAAGFTRHLLKPVELQVFQTAIEDVLRQRTAAAATNVQPPADLTGTPASR